MSHPHLLQRHLEPAEHAHERCVAEGMERPVILILDLDDREGRKLAVERRRIRSTHLHTYRTCAVVPARRSSTIPSMRIASIGHSINMIHYPTPGSLDEQGVGRPILELRDLWGRLILHATKAISSGGGSPSTPCPCGSTKKPCAGRIAIGAGRDGTLAAQCDRCEFFVSVSGWAGSWWDWTQR